MKFIMNFLRSPFQFRSSDQPSRKTESDSPVENMFIDPTTGLSTDSKWRAASPGVGSSSSISGSPRLQHRVPGFENNGNSPIEVTNETCVPQSVSNEDGEITQRVRVVPIKVESVDDFGTPKKRSSVFHSNSGTIPRSNQFGPLHPNFEDFHNRKRHSSGPAQHKKVDTAESKPKICNIPIFVEGRDTPVVPKTSSHDVPVHVTSPNEQSETVKLNGGNLAKCSIKSKCKDDTKQQNACDVSLKQISDILAELQSFKTAVEEFSGVAQDKQYRYLDEMLTRCMLKLDDVETHGNEKVRASRKAAIRAVQECINDLESRSQPNRKPLETENETGEMVATAGKEETVSEAGLPVCANIQEPTETTADEIKSSAKFASNEQSTSKDQVKQESLCPEEASPVISKLEDGSPETQATVVKDDENKNFEQAEDTVNKPVDMEGVETVTKELEESEVKVQDHLVNESEELKISEESARAKGEPMDCQEGTGVFDQSTVHEPMDSEVPEANEKSDSETAAIIDELVDSEMVGLVKDVGV